MRFLKDWISSLAFSQDESSIYIQTAHNQILTLDSSDLHVLSTTVCSEKSILYSGTILPLKLDDGKNKTLIASGTVLGGVVMWNLESQSVLHNLTTHEGSIFGVAFSSDGKLLASCSDDRSIRLWSVEDGEEIAVGWGHHARIWQLLFLPDNNKLISVSEDCTARIWSWQDESQTLICEQVLEGHLGRNVWCCSLGNGKDSSVLATGGSDGRVKLWDISLRDSIENSREKYSMISTGLINNPSANKRKQEIFKNYALIDYKHIIVGTSMSRLLFFNGDLKTWKCVSDIIVDFYSIIRVFDDGSSTAAIATRDGKLFIASVTDDIKVESFHVGHHFQGKLSDLLTFSIGKDNRFVILETQNPSDPVVIYDDNGVCRAVLNTPETFHPTAVVYDNSTELLYLGSRHGAVATYKISFIEKCDEALTPENCWRRVMSEDAITSIQCPSRNPSSKSSTLILTSRGGYFMTASVTNSNLQPLNLNKLPRCDIEGSSLSNGKLILYGFRTDLFFVWNHTDQYEVLTEKCGGAHRIWHFRMNPNDEDAYDFLYTKATEVNRIRSYGHRSYFQKSILQPVVHGREIRGLEFAPNKKYNQELIVATASEDTCVALNTLDPQTGLLTNWGSYEKHVSGITALHWTDDGDYLISSSGQEELTIWKVVVSNDNGAEGPHAYPLVSLPTTCEVPDLRIMNFTFYKLKTRLGTEGYLIVSVYSDSSFRGWIFDPESKKIMLVFSGRYRECCLLNCSIISVQNILYLSLSSTDGHLAIWRLGEEDTIASASTIIGDPTLRLQLHQSSVKDSFFYSKSPSSYIHISGGDDNALVAAEVVFDGQSVTGRKLFALEGAHSATITGVTRISEHSDKVTFVTASSDQNIRYWEATSEEFKLLDSKYTTVADTGVVDVHTETDSSPLIAIGGLGISFWTL